MEPKRGISQVRGSYSGYADVDSHRLHVQAVLGNTGRMMSEIFVAPWCAVAADYVDLCTRPAQCRGQIFQQFE
jgi:hypothetical protein